MNKQTAKSKLIIGIDGNEANVENRVGVNTYAYETLKAISLLEDEWRNEYEFRIFLSKKPLQHMPVEGNGWKYEVIPGKGLWIIRSLMPRLYKDRNKPHIFWSPSHYVPPFAPMPRICSIMDVGYLTFSGQFRKRDFWQLKFWTAWSLFVSKRILAISETTKKDIVRHYPFTQKKITTTLLGYDHKIYNTNFSKEDVRRVKTELNCENYILFMSTLKPSKNVGGLIKAWALISHLYPQTKLVIAGKKGWLFNDIFKLIEELEIKDRVIFTDFVPEEDKPSLIAGARLFVLPSFWEGFGLDVLSAMATGVPVVVSDRGSLPEVIGEAGLVVNPESAESIAKALQTILDANSEEYKKIVKKGISQAQKFSWENTARETLAVFRECL